MKPSVYFTLTAMLLGGVAYAQTPVASTLAEDQRNFDEALRIVRVTQLWNKPIDWKETGSTPKEVAAHVRTALGVDAPLIEIRGKDNSRSTFALKQANLGPTLSAVADLADANLWVFAGRLVLAPANALSPEEQAAIEDGKGGEWQKSALVKRGQGWNAVPLLEKSAVSIIGGEIKSLYAAKGLTPQVPEPTATPQERTAPYELTFGELSAASQNKLKELVEIRYSQIGGSTNPVKTITPLTIVGLNDTQENQIELSLQNRSTDSAAKRVHISRWYVPIRR